MKRVPIAALLQRSSSTWPWCWPGECWSGRTGDLLRDYIEKEEALPYVRGRFLAASFCQDRVALRCSFQEHTTDLPENAILAWTLYCLRGFPFARQAVKQQVRQAFRLVAGAVDLKHMGPEECHHRLYHRLNQDYQPMHALCRFFLDHSGPALGVGEREFTLFLVHMPTLFESFVAEWLKANLGGTFYLKLQSRIPLDGSETLSFRIDLVLTEVRSRRVAAVLDAKYKRAEEPDAADIQQIVAYAVQMGTKKAFLVYPSPLTRSFVLQIGEIEVRSLVFDLGVDLHCAGEFLMRQLLQGIHH